MKKITILGSTGSIGTQTLEVVDEQENIKVLGLAVNRNIDLLQAQIKRYKPVAVAVMDPEQAEKLRDRLTVDVKVYSGIDGLIKLATLPEIDTVVTAVVGMIGLKPTVEAIKAGKDIALANKETLVTAGSLIMPLAKKHKVNIYPVDSEHSAIYQSMLSGKASEVESIIITASGGPFRGYTLDDLDQVTKEQALKHPNWEMGAKITIDSSTLVNKGLEVIEAKWLFDLEPEQIQVVIHPESIIHSLVEFIDGSIIAQMGLPDMKLPIQYALAYPNRLKNDYKRLKLAEVKSLHFEEPDTETFIGLKLAFEALKAGKSMPIVYNAANEMAVAMFLDDQISYREITRIIKETMALHEPIEVESVEDVIHTEKWTYEIIRNR